MTKTASERAEVADRITQIDRQLFFLFIWTKKLLTVHKNIVEHEGSVATDPSDSDEDYVICFLLQVETMIVIIFLAVNQEMKRTWPPPIWRTPFLYLQG